MSRYHLWSWPSLSLSLVVQVSLTSQKSRPRNLLNCLLGWCSSGPNPAWASKTGFFLQEECASTEEGAPDTGRGIGVLLTKSNSVLMLHQREFLSWWGRWWWCQVCKAGLGCWAFSWPKSKKKGTYSSNCISGTLLWNKFPYNESRTGC